FAQPSTSYARRGGRGPSVRPCVSGAAPLGGAASLEEVDRGPPDVEADPGLIGLALHALFRRGAGHSRRGDRIPVAEHTGRPLGLGGLEAGESGSLVI